MVAYGSGPEGGNQLEHIIRNFRERGVKRRTAMVAQANQLPQKVLRLLQ